MTYLYLTKQELGKDFKDELYKRYSRLVNVCYFPNREVICPDTVETIHAQMNILLDRDYSSPLTFINLNDSWHYSKMKQVVELLRIWNLNSFYYGYADQKEFFESMDFLRKQFNSQKIDIYAAVGKWPRKFRKRRKGTGE